MQAPPLWRRWRVAVEPRGSVVGVVLAFVLAVIGDMALGAPVGDGAVVGLVGAAVPQPPTMGRGAAVLRARAVVGSMSPSVAHA